MESIQSRGLVPRQGRGLFNHGGYDSHSQGKIFLSSSIQAAFQWFEKVFNMAADQSEMIEDQVVVVLRIHDISDAQVDPIGDKDVSGSVYVTAPISPAQIEFWHPVDRDWVALEYWGDETEVEHGIERTDIEDDAEIHWPYDSFSDGGFKPPRESRQSSSNNWILRNCQFCQTIRWKK